MASRSPARLLSVAEAAHLLDWPEEALLRILERTKQVLPGASRRSGKWCIPELAIRRLIGSPRPVFSFSTLAEILDRDPNSLRRMARLGHIRAVRILGELRVPWGEVQRIMAPAFSFSR